MRLSAQPPATATLTPATASLAASYPHPPRQPLSPHLSPPPPPALARPTMAPSKTAVKGNRKKGGSQRQVELEERNQCNEELEQQIREEMERAQDQNMLEGDGSVFGEEDEEEGRNRAENVPEEDEGGANRKSAFEFIVPRPVTAPKSQKSLRKMPITPTKISGELNFLKRSINDLSSTPEPVTRKNPGITKEIENILLSQILSKLDKLSETVETQTGYILALEKKIEELSAHSKGNIQTAKANRAATKKIETMADRVAAMAATTNSPTNAIKTAVAPSNLGPSSNPTKVASLKKTGPHIIIDLAECEVSLNERPLKDIRIHLQSSIKNSNHTKAIEIQAMSRDNRHAEENLLRIHTDEWLSKILPRARVLATTFYPIRIDSVNASKILDPTTGRIMAEAATKISQDNGNLLVGRIGWLSQPGKRYGSMVLYLKEKSQAEAMLAKGFLEVGGESATTQIWEERGKTEPRCFNCQKQGHLAKACKVMKVCGYCAGEGHHHGECHSSTPKCAHCGGSHRAKDHKHQRINTLSGLRIEQQPTPTLSTTANALSLPLEASQFTTYMLGSQINSPIIFSADKGPRDTPKVGDVW